jgi:Flp pilus assembly protein TadB
MVCKIKYFLLILSTFFIVTAVHGQEAKVKHRQIERQQRKNDKKARKDYQKRVKRHFDAQSKETRGMMKSTYRKSKKATPVKPKLTLHFVWQDRLFVAREPLLVYSFHFIWTGFILRPHS